MGGRSTPLRRGHQETRRGRFQGPRTSPRALQATSSGRAADEKYDLGNNEEHSAHEQSLWQSSAGMITVLSKCLLCASLTFPCVQLCGPRFYSPFQWPCIQPQLVTMWFSKSTYCSSDPSSSTVVLADREKQLQH
mmetsp:Transcript_54386/g.122192  ORF Transcript_54386/g.122192 Transcript_54386/m.122192 type:complete len:135 (+) Transcript_54386:2831-3235(+)